IIIDSFTISDSLFWEYYNMTQAYGECDSDYDIEVYFEEFGIDEENVQTAIVQNSLRIFACCGGWDKYELIWDGLLTNDELPQANIIFVHHGIDYHDVMRCGYLYYDLSPLQSKTGGNKILLNIYAYCKSYNKLIEYTF
ncbi:MAG: hypothetical protein ABII90_11860, partial [Bacteroidota bacterium]